MFYFVQILFSSTKSKLDNFVRSDNLQILTAAQETKRIQNEKCFGTCKLSASSACLEVLTQFLFSMAQGSTNENFP